MSDKLKMVIPKGRLQEKVVDLLERIGIGLTFSTRSYRPVCSDSDIEIKILKPQNVSSMVALDRHDCGFTGYDWVEEQGLENNPNLVELLDLGYGKVRIVAAVPDELARNGDYLNRKLVIASEYQTLAQKYIERKGLDAVLIKAYGATEALPPEDADMIIDNTSTGSTLVMNRLTIVDELMVSTTRFVCTQTALNNPAKKEKLEQLAMLFKSVLDAEKKVLLEMNVTKDKLDTLVAELPSMMAPTVSSLYNDAGFAVKIAVSRKDVFQLIPKLVAMGATDILEYRLEKIVS